MKLKFFGIFLLACLMASCGKTVKIDSENIEGMLAGNFTVVPGEYEVAKDEKGNYMITVPVKRTNESVPFTAETVSVFSKETNGVVTFAGFGYEAYDAEGNKTGGLDAQNNGFDPQGQLAVLKLAPGATGELKISFENGKVPEMIKITSGLQFVSTGDITLTGSIGGNEIKNFTINANFLNKTVTGKYQTAKDKEDAFNELSGKVEKTELAAGLYVFELDLKEVNSKNISSDDFDCLLKLVRDGSTEPYYYTIYGDVEAGKGEDVLFNLKSEPLGN